MKLPARLRLPNVRLKARLTIYVAICCSLILFLFFLEKKTTSKADRLQAEYSTGKTPLDDLRPASRSVLFPEEEIARMRVTQYEDPLRKHWEGPGAEHIELFHSILSANPGGLYLDVGANEGVLMRLAAMMGHPTIGVEAIAQNYVSLLNMIEEKQYAANVRVVHAAASDRSGALVAFKENLNPASKQRNGQQLIRSSVDGLDKPGIQYTTTVVVDDILDYSIALMKLDCEGTEFLALMGSRHLFLHRKVKYVHFEFSPGNMAALSGKHSPKAMLNFLLDSGHRLFIEDCSHDISDQVIDLLPSRCAKQTDTHYFLKFRNADLVALREYEITLEKLDIFVDTLLEHSHQGSMLVNMLSMLL
ncbi:predicted protein [Micromonas commoda]|uniref:Methyltransferase FkbM domain-containing protein n=1 Tax=Micromonas commoda (strain RCC299 / NOUM17 / CCMP2709) TaxID=296587 RepID=C1EJJ0_MICCC|nr:predicted protein [Micromonas commoda]ACO68192.1 predicted protein [Micromonas commoda]|eukprot:XP_002506934.1 predicted protein [Micromonas commoda]